MNLTKEVDKLQQRATMGILIVDDRPENLLTLESIIEKEGRRIIKASGGNEALRLAIRENIGLIMMDIQMPEIDGIEVARLLRSNKTTRHIPIIFVSAINTTERPCMEDFEDGTVDYLHKPLNMEETRNKVAFHERMYYMRTESQMYKEAAEKNASQFEQFVYIVSHDLKAPLRAIENLTNWILDDLGDRKEGAISENLSLMKSRVNRMRSLLEGVLEYSRCGKIDGIAESIDLNLLAHAVFESITPPNGFTLEANDLPIVKMDHSRIYNILFHLIKNSVIHHHDPANGMIKISCEKNEHQYILTATDNGPGIKLQYAQKIFEVFTTLKSKDDLETTGIGLPIVKKLLNDIGEKIWLDTENVTGAKFRFTLSATS